MARPPAPDGQASLWFGDPVDLALLASQSRREHGGDWLPEPFCIEVGRRLLLAQLEFSQWILRRVEKVQFERERSVSRQISIDFVVRDDAPVFAGHGEQPLRLVPLTVMRRRTLVNFEVKEADRRIPMLGLRLTQQLDESMLLAAAEADRAGLGSNGDLRAFVQQAVAGTAEQVDQAVRLLRGEATEPTSPSADVLPLNLLAELRQCPIFTAAFNRLYRNFTLYVLLEAGAARHRVLTLAFDEPTKWSLQKPLITPKNQDLRQVRTYEPMRQLNRAHRTLLNSLTHLGLTATRIRFQTPAAEHATSYHFEATAPHGVRIVEASLLAGRPNEPKHPVSVDRIVGHTPSVGLHAIEIPNVSLCRVQLKLRVPLHSWLTTLVVSCFIIAMMMLVVAWQWPLTIVNTRWPRESFPGWSDTQVTNVVVLLVTASASAATLIAQREFSGLAAAMVSRLRAVGVISLSLPIAASVVLVYGKGEEWTGPVLIGDILWGLTALAFAACALTAAAAGCSWWAEVRSANASPWDMTFDPGQPRRRREKRSHAPSDTFDEAAHSLGFDRPAVGIASAEGWHAVYDWTDSRQRRAVDLLAHPFVGVDSRGPCDPHGGCTSWRSCPGRDLHAQTDPLARPPQM